MPRICIDLCTSVPHPWLNIFFGLVQSTQILLRTSRFPMVALLPMDLVADKSRPHSAVRGRSIVDQVGNTPMLGFKRITDLVAPVQVLAKAEWANPGGSVKDRAALNMILDGERRGLLTKKKTLIDATSGNTGIAYAMIGAERGYRVKLALPKNATLERKQCMLAYGAELILTDPTGGTDSAQRY